MPAKLPFDPELEVEGNGIIHLKKTTSTYSEAQLGPRDDTDDEDEPSV
jgi:hypothetical protein